MQFVQPAGLVSWLEGSLSPSGTLRFYRTSQTVVDRIDRYNPKMAYTLIQIGHKTEFNDQAHNLKKSIFFH